ncbi:type 1 glutamine amidotransferase family protein [Paenibacillus rigui]|uniref:Glutamine amidotransferase n=1 Tax=Paenibacillus rigui TaxID=554312 RepID=A0A229UQU0_9BACL|nr:type 1 glutamine amidotransferase family protein [Paenibacillus rigui]OXM85259.1 glutamine amidotransferase [Paenibacillus rigui]
MKKQVWIVLTDGFADWEASYISPELNKPEAGYQVRTIALDKAVKTSMGGFDVLPHHTWAEACEKGNDPAMVILPGGTSWLAEVNVPIRELVRHCFQRGIPVAAICDATTFLAKHGFLENHKHTGNTLGYLKQGAPEYRGERLYVEAQSVCDGNLITANGSAAVEFARDILKKLGVLEGEALEQWFHIAKHGFLSA